MQIQSGRHCMALLKRVLQQLHREHYTWEWLPKHKLCKGQIGVTNSRQLPLINHKRKAILRIKPKENNSWCLLFLWWHLQQNIFSTTLIVPHYLAVLWHVLRKKSTAGQVLHQSNINILKIAHWHNGRLSKKKIRSKSMSKQYEKKRKNTSRNIKSSGKNVIIHDRKPWTPPLFNFKKSLTFMEPFIYFVSIFIFDII